ncbi:A/G-specific adenine glycosylase [Hahella ganghwensis]|uniref:A/G-specific adenine glycosylase n=1 Tax=Hahella ganghwensis TaxID=286420 RepID=UPI0003677715|nr:A/G-specific adenine glycosylase [Hahella ganghwensis]
MTEVLTTAFTPEKFAENLLNWFDQHGRHDLPWQHPRSPYRVWLSEIMLQQTQVSTVIGYFNKFVERFPQVADLAAAPVDEVLVYWAGLGYYARARNLHKAAIKVMEDFNGEFPKDTEALQSLPGIGRSTAGAILAQAYNMREPILDGNVKRVLARVEGIHGWPGLPAIEKQLWKIAEVYTPEDRVVDYTQAIMDLGATLCSRSKPACERCPFHSGCQAYQLNETAELPTRKPKKKIPTVERYLLVLQDRDGRFLMERRPASGIWGGLWCFPESEKDAALENTLSEWRQHYSIKNDYELAEPFKHTFSHYHVILKPVLINLDSPPPSIGEDGITWMHLEQKDLALPAPIAQWLASGTLSQRQLL